MPCTIESCVCELSDINEIGESLFLTKSEAEAKLKELRDGENECYWKSKVTDQCRQNKEYVG